MGGCLQGRLVRGCLWGQSHEGTVPVCIDASVNRPHVPHAKPAAEDLQAFGVFLDKGLGTLVIGVPLFQFAEFLCVSHAA